MAQIIPIIEFSKRGNEDQVRDLLRMKHPVNKRDPLKNTPLHWAAAGGHMACMKVLTNWKGDVNAVNKNGDTPLVTSHSGSRSRKAFMYSSGSH